MVGRVQSTSIPNTTARGDSTPISPFKAANPGSSPTYIGTGPNGTTAFSPVSSSCAIVVVVLVVKVLLVGLVGMPTATVLIDL
jgi:hypothetical protein